MIEKQFIQILEERTKKMKETLSSKAEEYARDEDRLSNFKQGAVPLKQTPEKYLVNLWMKHVISICDFTNDLEKHGRLASMHMWNEKIGDAMNYLVLLEALLIERMDCELTNKTS